MILDSKFLIRNKMKNTIILHGTGSNPNEFWFPWLKEVLEKKGYEVWVPELPDGDNPDKNKWLPFIFENGKFNEETVIIGHSAGAAIILALLEDLDVKIRRAILVGGYCMSTGTDGVNGVLQKVYDWEKISNATTEKLIFINSDNDPWGCNDFQGRRMMDMAGGMQIIIKGEGHMGSNSFNQPYQEFPLLEKLVEL